eukprot:Gb_18760 [translate_table: standard]
MAELKLQQALWATSAGLVCLVLLLQWYFGKFRRAVKGLPPGTMGWPFIGETLQLVSAYKTTNPEPFVDIRRSRYGNVFRTHVFGKPTIFSTDPEVNKFILQNEGKLFVTSYPSSIANLMGKQSLLLMRGNLHKRLHSLTMSFANSSVLKDHLMFDIERLVCLNLDAWKDRVHLQDETKKITFELTVKQLLSFDPGQWTENLRKEYLQLIEGFFSLPLRLPFTTQSKALKARAKVAEELRVIVTERRTESENDHYDMLEALLSEIRTSEGEGLSDDQIIDFLLALLVAGYETTSTIMTLAVKFLTETPEALAELKGTDWSTKLRRDESCWATVSTEGHLGPKPPLCLESMHVQEPSSSEEKAALLCPKEVTNDANCGSSHEYFTFGTAFGPLVTLSVLRTSAVVSQPVVSGNYLVTVLFDRKPGGFYLLSICGPARAQLVWLLATRMLQAVQQEEHETIRRRKGEHERLEWDDYKSMTFTQCVISETLRIANIIGGVFRRALCDVEIKGYTIPKDWMVFPSFRAVHLDQDLYSDARKFNPWRWQGNNPSTNFATIFTPFGGGPRLCPGYELARVEISVFLHHMVTLFSWEVVEEDKLIFFPTTRTVKRYPINLVRRGRRSLVAINP